jgi:hypothetical protein
MTDSYHDGVNLSCICNQRLQLNYKKLPFLHLLLTHLSVFRKIREEKYYNLMNSPHESIYNYVEQYCVRISFYHVLEKSR